MADHPLSSQVTHLVTEFITATDLQVFDRAGRETVHRAYCALPDDQLNYGTTVTYLLQQIHGYHYKNTDPMGYYFYSPDGGETVCPIAIARRPFDGAPSIVVVSPRGPNVDTAVETLYRTLRDIGEFPFYVKNPPDGMKLSVSSSEEFTPWNKEAPFEDDTYSNVIIDVPDITSKVSVDHFSGGGEYRDVKQKLGTLMRKTNRSLDEFKLEKYEMSDLERAEKIIGAFFEEKEHRNSLSKPADYYNLFRTDIDWRNAGADTVRAVMTHGDDNIGLVMSERIANTDHFGVYATLGLKRDWQFSELQMVLVLHEIFALGGRHADIGGAETAELQTFHAKFLPASQRRANREILETPRRQPWLQLA